MHGYCVCVHWIVGDKLAQRDDITRFYEFLCHDMSSSLQLQMHWPKIPVAMLCKARACGRWLVGVTGSNPPG